jgi:hypothetical protein
MAGDPTFWLDPASPASIPARRLEIRPGSGDIARDPVASAKFWPVWPESSMVSPESGDIGWTSSDFGLISRIPAPTGV